MILQALHAYYERRQRLPDPADRLPQPGLEDKEIPFILELAPDGRLIAITDTREIQGKKKIPKSYRVPQGVKRASGVAANLLWDTAEYVLGLDTKGKPERVAADSSFPRPHRRLADARTKRCRPAGGAALSAGRTAGRRAGPRQLC